MSTVPNRFQPQTTSYEWGGPFGAAFMVVSLPLLVVALNSLCNTDRCDLAGVRQLPYLMWQFALQALPSFPKAVGIELCWMAAHVLFYLLPIGRRVSGQRLRNGAVLSYRLNAIHAFVLSHVLLFGLHLAGVVRLTFLADIFPALLLASIFISIAMSIVLYIASFRKPAVLTALGGNTGNAIYDFWIGRELNPRTGAVDWKFVCELRPGLVGWSVLNWVFVLKSVELGSFSPSILLSALLQSVYVADGLLLEVGNLTMMDIVTDGFGFMLCFGDLTWVPFIYTLQTKYLAYHGQRLSAVTLMFSSFLVLLGYALFRLANTEKDRFRTNPSDPRVRHLKVMTTSKGKSLIVSGCWGICRHPNYVGDWLMALGWATLTGASAAIPYFHPIYFGVLLIHRQLRDEESMREKYGDTDWKRFCSIVKYRLIPYVY